MNAVKNFFSSCKTHSSKIALIVSIVGIICLLSGTSYALFNSTVTGTKKQVVQTGKVKLQVTEPASGLSLDEMNEYTDVEGLLQDDYYEFSVKNIGDAPVSYKLYLLDDADKMVTYEGSILDDKFIRVGIERNGEELGPLSLLEANRLVDATKINIGVANEYRVRTWLNFDDATDDELDAMEGEYTKFLKVKVVAEQTFDDLDAPTCTISSLLNNDGNSATLTVTSTDTDLADAPYSWDKKTYSTVNTKVVNKSGIYTVYMIDKSGNVGNCSITIDYFGLDLSGANVPVLASNMVPVYYDDGDSTWRKADSTNKNEEHQWFDYDNKMWANVVVDASHVGSAVGTEIDVSSSMMLVWVPRYQLNTTNFNKLRGDYISGGCDDGSTSGSWNCSGLYIPSRYTSKPVDITFVDTNTNAHAGFTFDNRNLPGIWFGKFSGVDSSSTGSSFVTSNISTAFNTIQGKLTSIESASGTTVDSHMSKNSEWSVAAYLANTKYGICEDGTCLIDAANYCNSNSHLYSTGANCYYNTTARGHLYDTAVGVLSSTTKNIYGIYDMTGGYYNYVMGVVNAAAYSSGFSILPNSKYFDTYTSSSLPNKDALFDTCGIYGTCATSLATGWLARGGVYSSGSYNTFFGFSVGNGSASANYSTRVVITN